MLISVINIRKECIWVSPEVKKSRTITSAQTPAIDKLIKLNIKPQGRDHDSTTIDQELTIDKSQDRDRKLWLSFKKSDRDYKKVKGVTG